MWRSRFSSFTRSRRSSSVSPSPSGRSRSVDKASEVSNRLPSADTLVPPPEREVRANPLGLCILYAPEEAPTLDIIFIHGLGGASIRTWCQDGDPSLCWPKNWLPLEPGFRHARILSFGYDAGILSRDKTISNVSDFAKSLLTGMEYGKDSAMNELGVGKVWAIHISAPRCAYISRFQSCSLPIQWEA